MAYDLLVGSRSYSSWSLRGWLLFERFGIPVRVREAQMYGPGFAEALADFAPARTVPAARAADGALWHDSLAIAEGLAERHPEAGHWPAAPRPRALARSMAAEMHSGFAALRSACPMNLRTAWRGFEPTPEVRADLERIEALWGLGRGMAEGEGAWLFGRYCAADAFFAPVVMRIAGYGLPVGEAARAYVEAHLADPALRRWRAMGEAIGAAIARYDMNLPRTRFPVPEPIPARAVAEGPAANDACPYSGLPVAHFMEAGGRIWGFCNAACRDETAVDPAAWPRFMAVYQS